MVKLLIATLAEAIMSIHLGVEFRVDLDVVYR
jgi:hypothetical protein